MEQIRLVKTGALTVAVCAGLLSGAPQVVRAGDKLSYFTWSDYERNQFHKSYDKQHPEGIDGSVFGDDNEALARVKAGFAPDIAHPCSDAIPRWQAAGLLQPIDTKRIKNWDKISPLFKDMNKDTKTGKTWMVPWDWGNVSILYRTDKISNPEQSWSLLWDPKYKGKMATIDSIHDTPLVGALMAKVDPFKMSTADIAKVKAKLMEQRPLIRTYSNDMTSVEQALASGELYAAMTWNSSEVALKKEKVPVKFMTPKEGMLTWMCGMVILKNAKNLDKVYDFINSRLEAESGKELITAYGYGSSTKEAFGLVSKQQLNELSIPADPETALKKTIFIRPMENVDAISAMFESVKAGH